MGVPAIASSFNLTKRSPDIAVAVEATVQLTNTCLEALGRGVARHWPRHPTHPGRGGLRLAQGCVSYAKEDEEEGAWESTLLEAFAAGDLLLNLNVPKGWGVGRSGAREVAWWMQVAICTAASTRACIVCFLEAMLLAACQE